MAVVPCLDEAAQIGTVVAGILDYLPNIIVVDDGSADATAERARQAGAEVIRLAKNSGKGAALQAGWLRAAARGFTWVLLLDGDGQHAVADIPKFFACADKTKAALVVGNRMGNTAGMPLVRRCVNRWMSRWISRLTGSELPDSQCGFRLAHLPTLLRLPLPPRRFEIESAMLVGLLAAGRSVEFVPVRTIYECGASKINPLADTWRWLRWRLAQRAPLRACSTIRVP